MIDIRFEVDKKQLRSVEKDLKKLESRMPKILSRTADKTAVSARVSLVREMQGTYTEKSSGLKRNIEIQKASYDNPSAVIKLTGGPQPAIYFRHSKGGRGGAKLQVRTDGAFAPVVSQKGGRKAFIAQMPSGHKGIFQRREGEYMTKAPRMSRPNINKETQHTEQIKELFAPSTVKMAKKVYGSRSGLTQRMGPEIQGLFQKYFEQQVKLVFRKKGGA